MRRRQQPCLEAAARAMAEVGDVPKEVSEKRCEDNSCSTAGYSPPSSNLLTEMVKGTEQSCYAQAEVLGTEAVPWAMWNFNANGRISLMVKL